MIAPHKPKCDRSPKPIKQPRSPSQTQMRSLSQTNQATAIPADSFANAPPQT
ncbi:MAG: hypothetical protein V7K48_11755 [Nostoc sp.]|uniref:hypothetical protein n=1 Tax=Nostoc sp. TaxID=1180 RepID=UPI002FF7FB37